MQKQHLYLNGEFVTEDKAFISVAERGFLFGDGVFDTMRCINKKIEDFELHQERLKKGLESIEIDFPLINLKQKILKLIELNQETNCIVRLSISRGIGSQGYMPVTDKPTLVIETKPFPEHEYSPKKIMVSSYEKVSAKALPIESKLMQGMNSTLALMEARKNNYFESLLLNAKQEITEAASANIFWIANSNLYTPSIDCGILDGITRKRIINSNPNVITGHYKLADLKNAELIFLTNSAYIIMPIDELYLEDKILWKSSLSHKKIQSIINEISPYSSN